MQTNQYRKENYKKTAHNMGLAKVAVQCSSDTFVLKIPAFAKRQTVSCNFSEQPSIDRQLKI